MDGVEGVEPSSGLVDAFRNEVRGCTELLLAEAAQAFLRIWHRAGVEPHVDEVALPGHLASAVGHEVYVVHIWPVEVYPVIISKGHVRRVETLVLERIGCHDSGCYSLLYLGVELGCGADALLFLSILGAPDRERGAPVAASGEVPVLDVLEPLSETSGTCGLRLPGNGLVQCNHLVLDSRSLYEPRIKRIVEHRLVGSPAVRIAVDVLLDPECPAVHLHHHAEVDIKGRGVCRNGIIEGILDVPAGIFGIFRAYVPGGICRIHILEAVETSFPVDKRLEEAGSVLELHRRYAECGSNLLVVSSEGRGDVNHARTVLGGDIVSGDDFEGVPVYRLEPRYELAVADAGELGALHFRTEHLIRHELVARLVVGERNVGGLRIEPCAHESLRKHVYGLLSGIWIEGAHPDIFDLRTDAEGGI